MIWAFPNPYSIRKASHFEGSFVLFSYVGGATRVVREGHVPKNIDVESR